MSPITAGGDQSPYMRRNERPPLRKLPLARRNPLSLPAQIGARQGRKRKNERKMHFFCRIYCRFQNYAYLCTAIERDCEDIEIKIWCVSSAG